jgi:beta-glucosidase
MKQRTVRAIITLVTVSFTLSGCLTRTGPGEDQSMDPAQRRAFEKSSHPDIESKIDGLLSQMTIEEKIGQMMQLNQSAIVAESNWGAGTDLQIVTRLDTGKLGPILRKYHVGSFLNGIAIPAETWYTFYKDIQEFNMKTSRLKIPVIYGVDHMHGPNYLEGGTIFPHAINTAATFNNQFPADMARVTAIETADLGHLWLFAPVLDLGRTPLWGRFYETLGESPHVEKTMAGIYIKTVQNEEEIAPYKIAATAKHFLGYSDPKYGWDRGVTDMSEQAMYEFHVPAFQAAVDAGIRSFMINSGEVNGEPVHSSYRLLTTLLRDEMKFKGVVVTDWEDIIRLWRNHRTALDERDATYQAISAGIDVAMTPYTTDFGDHLLALVKEGKITEERIDLSVARVLRMKLEIGLFENPLPRNDRFSRIGTAENRAKALEAARESVVLMKNDGILPLNPSRVKHLLVAGPTADSKNALAGGWTLRWQTNDDSIFPKEMHTLFTGLQKEFPGVRISLAASANEVRSLSSGADAILLGVGELAYAEGFGSILDIRLPEDQISLIRAAQSTGKPVILVMISGRPRVITDVYGACSAVLFAGLPGFEGGQAIAGIVSGRVNPSGKLSFNYPHSVNRLVPHNHKSSEVRLAHEIPNPVCLVPFGYGLSYTSFEYSNLTLSDTVVTENGEITATVTVKNTGTRDGKEAVLWFLFDEAASLSRPVRDLKHYEKKMIRAGESANYSFTVRPGESLGFPDARGRQRIEPGYFTLTAGDQSVRFRLSKER